MERSSSVALEAVNGREERSRKPRWMADVLIHLSERKVRNNRYPSCREPPFQEDGLTGRMRPHT